ncbi:anillin isoform X2 [Photinus pyralis]|uniref:anillin isoform X2 n=1 Tax=Photinus pyralis TaxID=7054 RepID=UPI0012674AAB|nr:anillin isoform X2 [Photinus pyralis]
MDPFTERILERARERQKKLLQSKDIGTVSPLGESNTLSTTSLEDFKSVNMTATVSDSMLCTKSLLDSNLITETQSEGNLTSMVRQNSKTRISSNITGSPQSHLKTLNIQRENFNMEIKLSSTENVRVEVEFQEENEEGKENIKQDTAGLRDDAKMRLQRLGRLYAGGEDANISSPIHQTEAKFVVDETPSKKVERKGPGRLGKGLGALNTLAQDINQWEDDLSTGKIGGDKPSVKKKSWKPPAPRPPISSVRESAGKVKDDCVNVQVSDRNSHTKEEQTRQINLDPTLVETLESQGFTRTVSNSRLVYNYNKKLADETKSAEIRSPSKMKELRSESIIEEVEECDKEKKVDDVSVPIKHNLKGNIANKAALFEANSNSSPNRNGKDPALLSLSERKALFEKNKGGILVPKAPISMAAPVKPVVKPVSPVRVVEKRSPPKYLAPRPPIRKADITDSSAFRVTPGESGGIASKVAALFKNKSTISQQQIENEIKEQRQKEMDILLHRFHKNKAAVEDIERAQYDSDDDGDATETTAMISKKVAEIVKTNQKTPSPPPLPPPTRKSGGKRCSLEDSPKVAASLEDVKRIKVSPAKPGKLYPCLSDIEAATETETEVNTASPSPNNSSYEACSDSDGTLGDTSFGREVLETVCKNASPPKRTIYMDSTESDMSDILDDMDDYLDEAMAYDVENGPTPPKHKRSRSPIDKGSHSSSSFQYKNFTPSKPTSKPSTPYQTPIKEPSPLESDESPAFVVDGDDVLPLTHTVSFYRKQQIQGSKTPVRQVIKYPAIQENSDSSSKEEDVEVQSKICSLVEEVTKQQTIISQTSQALNLCYSTPEFTGSTEQVEAEKVLLLATHRRAAAQREIERLSVLKTLHSDNKLTENIPLEKGKLIISNIVLPLKRDYVRALNATGGKGHHVVCLIKCADQVYSTQLVSTVATNDRNPNLELNIPGTIHFNNIYSNFTAQFEVYCLQAQNESLPHDVKYHINKKGGSKITPKKGKSESRLIRPPKESPGGPQAVRSPTFALMGYVVFSIQATKRKNWTLNNAPSMSPLEGIVEMRVKCEFTMKVEHHGFLTMFEDISGFGAWHRRWCMLQEHSLSYWKYPDDEKKKPPIDTLDLSTCITTQVGPVRRDICARLNTFLIETKRPVQPHDKDSLVMQCNGDITIIRHLLSADTKEERNEWCTAFNKALATASMLRGTK